MAGSAAPAPGGHVNETYLKVRGRWTYLYRAVDRGGNLIDAMLSELRDMEAAKAFFRSAKATMGFRLERVTMEGHGSYPRATRTVLGRTVRHRTSACLNNRLEARSSRHQGRDPMYARLQEPCRRHPFCCEHGELRDLLRPRRRHNQIVTASPRRVRIAKSARIALDTMTSA